LTPRPPRRRYGPAASPANEGGRQLVSSRSYPRRTISPAGFVPRASRASAIAICWRHNRSALAVGASFPRQMRKRSIAGRRCGGNAAGLALPGHGQDGGSDANRVETSRRRAQPRPRPRTFWITPTRMNARSAAPSICL
jgi:hypothetical protein